MPVFEHYRESNKRKRAPALEDLLIRPAVLTDVTELADMEAAREGGEPAEYASRLERAISLRSVRARELVLAAEHAGRLVGIAKARAFTPAEDAPPNVAPSGWYLSGVIVVPEHRRRGIGRELTRARLEWIARRDHRAYYFANVRNRVSIEMHQRFGFVEMTRDFTYPGVTFEGGMGVLFRAELMGSER